MNILFILLSLTIGKKSDRPEKDFHRSNLLEKELYRPGELGNKLYNPNHLDKNPHNPDARPKHHSPSPKGLFIDNKILKLTLPESPSKKAVNSKKNYNQDKLPKTLPTINLRPKPKARAGGADDEEVTSVSVTPK
jgi:hypothetical protein